MLLHRCMSEREFLSLLKGEIIYGMYDIGSEPQSSGTMQSAVSFYVDDVWWVDKVHKIFAIVELPDCFIELGYGTYWASKEFEKTHIWTGRRGKTQYRVKEAYAPNYALNNVHMISLPNHTDSYKAMYREKLKYFNVQEMPLGMNPLVRLNRLHSK